MGNRSLSEPPFRAITSFKRLIPPIGTRSDPVVNSRSFFFDSNGRLCTISQKYLIVDDLSVYPLAYVVDFSSSTKSKSCNLNLNKMKSFQSWYILFLLFYSLYCHKQAVRSPQAGIVGEAVIHPSPFGSHGERHEIFYRC